MQPTTDISIDLPKLANRPIPIPNKKLQKITPLHFQLKHPAKIIQDPLRKLVQRYKT